MPHRATPPQQWQQFQPSNPTTLGRPPSRTGSAGYSRTTPGSSAYSTASGGTPAGSPSRRPNKRSSVTVVVWPDAVLPQAVSPSASSSRVSSAGGSRGAVAIPTAAAAAANAVNVPAAAAAAAASAIVVPIPTAPKRTSLTTGAFTAAGSATGPSSPQRTSLDFTAAPSAASAGEADSDGGSQLTAARHGSYDANVLQSVAGGQVPPAARTSSAQRQHQHQPVWLASPPFEAGEQPSTSEVPEKDVATSHLSSQEQQQQQCESSSPTSPPPLPRQSCNTNGVCEGIVTGVRHAAGGAGLWGLAIEEAPLPPPSSFPFVAQSLTSETPAILCGPHTAPPNAARTSPFFGSATTVAGHRASGPFATPALPQYNTRMSDGAHLLPEKRTSNPFTSYSNDLFAADLGTQSGTTGILVAPPSIGDVSNTGDLVLYQQQLQQQQQQQQQQHQRLQRASAALQRTATECNDDLQQLLADAEEAYRRAEACLLDEGLSLIGDWMRTRDLFFSAGALFAAVGDPAQSARCLLHATFINRAFHNEDEALTTLAMSVEQLKKAHPRVAVESLLRLAPCYAQRHLRYQAARCYREAAELLETELGEKETAVELYRTALEVYADTQAAAKTLSRAWERHVRQVAQRTPSSAAAAVALRRGEGEPPSPASPAEELTASVSTSTSFSNLGETSLTRHNMKAGQPPPHYQVSTSVQRSLIEACRERLLVLLTQLYRYPEVLEVALTCADGVPRALPRTKYLLCATLSVLARGVATPAEAGDQRGEAMMKADMAAATTPPVFMSAAAEAADALYFDSLYDTEKIFSTLQEEDRAFQRGKENALVRALLSANTACSLTLFDEAVRTYKGYSTTEPNVVLDLLLEQCRACLYEHVERFA